MAFPATLADIRNAVIAKTRLDPTADASRVNDWINQAYADATLRVEANTGIVTMTLTVGSASYTLPSQVLRIKEMYVTPVGSIQSAAVRMTSLDDILAKRRSAGNAVLGGYVTHYALLGINDLEVYPTPGTADTITMWCVQAPTWLANDTDTPILAEPFASKLLEYGALAEAADWRGDPSESEYRQLYELWVQKLQSHLTRKRGGQPGQFHMFPTRQFPPHDPSTDVPGY